MDGLNAPYYVEPASWQVDREGIEDIRREVFIVEQAVPEDEEWDDDDPTAQHFLAFDLTGHPIGTARLTTDGRIGRVAVLTSARGTGVGAALMRSALEAASARHMPEVRLAAQSYALAFYERLGFAAYGDEFDDVGIPHRWMKKTLAAEPGPRDPRQVRERLPEDGKVRDDFDDRSGLIDQWIWQVEHARRGLSIFTRDLDPRVLDQPGLMAAVRRLASGDTRPEIRILVLNSAPAVQRCHPLIALAQRLPSVIQVRVPARDHQDYPSSFSLSDEQHLLFRPFGDQYAGYALRHHRLEARRLAEIFLPMWEAGSPDPEFRQLGL